MFSFLNKPYPAPDPHEVKGAIVKAFVAAVVVTSVLAMIQPFGLDKLVNANKPLLFLGYGLITFLSIVLIELILVRALPSLFSEKNWKVYKELLLNLLTLLIIGLFNGIYNSLTLGGEYNLLAVAGMILNTAIVGICPLTVLVVMDYYRLVTKYMEQSADIAGKITDKEYKSIEAPTKNKIILKGSNDGEVIELRPEELLFVGSQANYVSIYHLKNGEEAIRKVFRTTLSNIERQLNGQDGIIRCHRGGIVNLNQVVKSSGNAQGLKLKLTGIDEPVSVSRKYVPVVRQHFDT